VWPGRQPRRLGTGGSTGSARRQRRGGQPWVCPKERPEEGPGEGGGGGAKTWADRRGHVGWWIAHHTETAVTCESRRGGRTAGPLGWQDDVLAGSHAPLRPALTARKEGGPPLGPKAAPGLGVRTGFQRGGGRCLVSLQAGAHLRTMKAGRGRSAAVAGAAIKQGGGRFGGGCEGVGSGGRRGGAGDRARAWGTQRIVGDEGHHWRGGTVGILVGEQIRRTGPCYRDLPGPLINVGDRAVARTPGWRRACLARRY